MGIIWVDDLEYYNSISSIGIKYIWLITIPTGLLIVQIFLNKRLVWIIIFGLTIIYSIWTFFNLGQMIIIDSERDYVKGMTFDIKQIIGLIAIISIILILNWIIFKLKPNK